jgi:uncharacterized membrane protein
MVDGVVLSMALLLVGLVWHWFNVGKLDIDDTIAGMNLFQFVCADMRNVAEHALRPHLFVNLGFTVLLFTPYLRVFISLLPFGFVERNWKYTVFISLVLSVLTYSLFLSS